MGGTNRGPPVGRALVSAVVDHVRLGYAYLDEGDLDGYGSLLADDAWLARPGLPVITGRDRVLAELTGAAGPPGGHRVHRITTCDDRVVVRGRCGGRAARWRGGAVELEFLDEITFSADGLLLGLRQRVEARTVQ